MTAYQKAKLLMVKAVIALCDDNNTIISTVAALVTALNELKAKTAEIDDTAQLAAVNLTGITTDKSNSRQNLCELSADIAGIVYAFAAENSNNTLKQEVNYPISKLQRVRDAEIALVCRTIYDRADEFKTELADYGITNEMLTELNTAITNYQAAAPKPRTAISNRKSRKEILKQLFRELDAILFDRMDKLIGKFRKSHPEFHEAYFNVRELIDPPTTTTQLKGKVTDSATNAPIKGALITVVQPNKTALTNSSGEYSIKPIEHGTVTVQVVKEGYQPYENDEIEIKMGDVLNLDVSLVSN